MDYSFNSSNIIWSVSLMVKLKTLKDLEIWKHSTLMAEEMLKQEAIRWVKADLTNSDQEYILIHFFNITEEEIK